ncbi:isochorismate synthase [Aequorivita echinoideorum]|uniref:isochorismate synthase n=1 Tax=Aequorivita echinoideorum TaxID=1549647 RepID=A0ABS5S7J8_9FLAO|nr:isochorismate synthase [Aequorivita echinoideorum]MBT0608958.1 isochorismate synthase [Aequorivita echinoideorum]
MDFPKLVAKVSEHYSKKLPFVLFSYPKENTLNIIFQDDAILHTTQSLSAEGFVFAPFDYEDIAYYIPKQNFNSAQFPENFENSKPSAVKTPKSTVQKKKYIQLVEKTIEYIKSRKAVKIVLSRSKEFELPNFDIETLINQLFGSNPDAFKYIWFHPETDMWCGATPEILVEINDAAFKTMALAGTQKDDGREPVIWPPKEIDEQQLVTEAITTSLQKVTSVLKVSKAYTHRAGSLLHLRTDITGMVKRGKATLTTIAAALHPTPAVCGTPQKIAKDFILKNERHKREFYTGFLGPINAKDATSTLMVNLRCMKILDGKARIFVGGGITISSIAAEEWEETQNKMQTMLEVLKPML